MIISPKTASLSTVEYNATQNNIVGWVFIFLVKFAISPSLSLQGIIIIILVFLLFQAWNDFESFLMEDAGAPSLVPQGPCARLVATSITLDNQATPITVDNQQQQHHEHQCDQMLPQSNSSEMMSIQHTEEQNQSPCPSDLQSLTCDWGQTVNKVIHFSVRTTVAASHRSVVETPSPPPPRTKFFQKF